MTKTCRKCSETKDITDYPKMSASKDGLHSRCKVCIKVYNQSPKGKASKRKYNQSSKSKIYNKNYLKEYRIENKQRIQEQIKSKSTEVQGVYALYDNGECLYVGESCRLNHRLYIHKSFTRKPSRSKRHRKLYEILNENHPNFVFGIVEQTSNHKEREKHYINKLNPLYNERV